MPTSPPTTPPAAAAYPALPTHAAQQALTASTGWPTVLVLASGRGERFLASGGRVHKLKALLAGRTVLEHTLAAVRDSGLPWHLEDAGHPGMGDTIGAAVRATPNAAGWLVLPGDLPLVQPATLRQLALVLRDLPCHGPHGVAPMAGVVPEHAGRKGHPVGFSAGCGEQGAARIVQRMAEQGWVRWVEVADAGTVTDIDTVQDLERAACDWAVDRNHPGNP
jgi:molybdenum cofactor cytidylyltransferase